MLSAQQITSCTYEAGRDGCNGGRAEAAIPSAVRMGGVMASRDYPYVGSSTPCAFDIDKAVTRPLSMWQSSGSEAPMIERISRVRPPVSTPRAVTPLLLTSCATGARLTHEVEPLPYRGR